MKWVCQFAGIAIAAAMILIPRTQAAAADNRLPSLPSGFPARSGETSLRHGDFAAARLAFEEAAARNPSDARAWWGLGRIQQLHFRREAARDLFSKAYRLAPLDPEIVRSYLDFVGDPNARSVLLRNLIAITENTHPESARWAQARLELEDRLAGRETGVLSSAYADYRIPLGGFRPAGSGERGLVVAVRVNGGRPLRLVLDTGARGILIHASAARDLGLEALVEAEVGGFGVGGAIKSTLSLARSLSLGDLEFRDCLVEVSANRIAAGVDGVLGPSLFERFVVRIDPRSQILQLTARKENEAPRGDQAVGLDRLLLVRAEVASGRAGWFLLDTGAAFTAVAADSVTPVARSGDLQLAGLQGIAGASRISQVWLRVAGKAMADSEAVALDLAGLSRKEGIEISGILGYSALSRWPLTIDFRTGRVQIGDADQSH